MTVAKIAAFSALGDDMQPIRVRLDLTSKLIVSKHMMAFAVNTLHSCTAGPCWVHHSEHCSLLPEQPGTNTTSSYTTSVECGKGGNVFLLPDFSENMWMDIKGSNGWVLLPLTAFGVVQSHTWSEHPEGYCRNSSGELLHRFLMKMWEPASESCSVDHKNKCKWDNTRDNLHWCSTSQQLVNRLGWTLQGVEMTNLEIRVASVRVRMSFENVKFKKIFRYCDYESPEVAIREARLWRDSVKASFLSF